MIIFQAEVISPRHVTDVPRVLHVTEYRDVQKTVLQSEKDYALKI